MISPEELRALAGLLQNMPTASVLSPERQQEILLFGAVAALEEVALQGASGALQGASGALQGASGALQGASGALQGASAAQPGASEADAPGLNPTTLLRQTAASHPLPAVREHAFRVIVRLAREGMGQAIDAIYRLAVEEEILGARQLIQTHAWQPGDPLLRALFDWFSSLEKGIPFPEGSLPLLTRAFFEEATPALQRRLLATAAAVHMDHWAEIVSALQNRTPPSLMLLVERYPTYTAIERQLVIDQVQRLAADGLRDAQEIISQLFIRHEDPLARQIALEQQYFPDEPEQRALFFFLSESWEQYHTFDFDHNLLGAAYEQAPRSIRRRLLEHSRHSGQMDWLRGLGSSGEVRWLSDLTDADWDLAIRRLTDDGKFADLWRLAQAAPPVWSAVILDLLSQRKWSPEREPDRAGFENLVSLARHCLANPLMIRPSKGLYVPAVELSGLAIHPNGNLLAAGSSDQRIIQWNLPHGKLRENPLMGPAPITRAIAFSPDGELLASAASDHRIRIFRLHNGQIIKTLEGHHAMVRSLAVHPDGRTLYSAGFDGTIQFWRFPYGPAVKSLTPGPGEIFAMSLGAGGKTLLSAGVDCLVRVWALPEGTASRQLLGHKDTITHLAASPTSELVASAGRDGVIRLWNYASGGLLRTIQNTFGPFTAICMHPNDQVLISGHQNGDITLWSLSTGQPIHRLSSHRSSISGIILSPKGDTLYSSDSGGSLRSLQVWDLSTFLTIHLPGEVSRPGAASELFERMKKADRSSSEEKWLEFSVALARWRERFDIELGELETIRVGEFDIEL